MKKSTVAVNYNPYNNLWGVGWKWEDGEFTPYECGFATKEEAEALIPGFDERVARDTQAIMDEKEEEEREQNKRFPNLGYVRDRIRRLRDSGNVGEWAASFDANQKLDWLLDLDLHEHIRWPLPSWPAIKSGRVYGR